MSSPQQLSSVCIRIPMQDYKSLCVVVMICANWASRTNNAPSTCIRDEVKKVDQPDSNALVQCQANVSLHGGIRCLAGYIAYSSSSSA